MDLTKCKSRIKYGEWWADEGELAHLTYKCHEKYCHHLCRCLHILIFLSEAPCPIKT